MEKVERDLRRLQLDSLVILLTGGIPQTQRHRHPVDHDLARVVVEDGGDVLPGEGVGGV